MCGGRTFQRCQPSRPGERTATWRDSGGTLREEHVPTGCERMEVMDPGTQRGDGHCCCSGACRLQHLRYTWPCPLQDIAHYKLDAHSFCFLFQVTETFSCNTLPWLSQEGTILTCTGQNSHLLPFIQSHHCLTRGRTWLAPIHGTEAAP